VRDADLDRAVPAALAALVAATRERRHGAIEVSITHAGRPQSPADYPLAADASAAQWNAAAARHNYVEFVPEPRRADP
jgi:hypothetical protein